MVTPLRDIYVVSFDVWNTLVTSNQNYKSARDALFAEILLGPAAQNSDIDPALRDMEVEMDWLVLSTGRQYGFLERLTKLYELLPWDERIPDLSYDVTEYIYHGLIRALEVNPPLLREDGLPELLMTLKTRGYRIAIISNTGFLDGKPMRKALAACGLAQHIDYWLFSNELNVSKPKPRIFRHLVHVAGVEPAQILHVGDDLIADYDGARSVGMNSLHLCNDNDSLSVKITSLQQLLDIL